MQLINQGSTKHGAGIAIGKAVVATVAGAVIAAVMVTSAMAQEREVTSLRLINSANEPDNWLHNHGDYNSSRFSKLAQINRDSVSGLKMAFAVAMGGHAAGALGLPGSLQATPLVNDGYMYMPNGWGEVFKIDVRSGSKGEILWIMDPGVDPSTLALLNNRGVALYKDLVISGTVDGRVIGTDRDSGEVVWETVTRTDQVVMHKAAPLVVGDKVLIGQSAGDWGTRGFLLALDAATGEEIWKTYTIPAPGEPGAETWMDDHDAWKTGGASLWVTGSYDPDTNLTMWGTGNAVPMFDPEYRPGDNLYSDSTVAFDVDTGAIAWYFQYTPGDYLDYDEVGSQLLFDVEIGGQMRKVLGHFGRNGFWYTLDRGNGSFINGSAYLDRVTWTEGLDPKTGLPLGYQAGAALQEYIPGSAPRRGQPAVEACPHLQGGVNFWPASYNPMTGLAYGAAFEGCFDIKPNEQQTIDAIEADSIILGGDWTVGGRVLGSISGVDPATGEVKVKVSTPFPQHGGVLTTAGGLVFAGHLDGTFAAYDAETLAELWSVNTGTPFKAPPMTYSVNGKQYVAIAAGWVGLNLVPIGTPELDNQQNSSILWVFAL